jgi:hypothetical protein
MTEKIYFSGKDREEAQIMLTGIIREYFISKRYEYKSGNTYYSRLDKDKVEIWIETEVWKEKNSKLFTTGNYTLRLFINGNDDEKSIVEREVISDLKMNLEEDYKKLKLEAKKNRIKKIFI